MMQALSHYSAAHHFELFGHRLQLCYSLRHLQNHIHFNFDVGAYQLRQHPLMQVRLNPNFPHPCKCMHWLASSSRSPNDKLLAYYQRNLVGGNCQTPPSRSLILRLDSVHCSQAPLMIEENCHHSWRTVKNIIYQSHPILEGRSWQTDQNGTSEADNKQANRIG